MTEARTGIDPVLGRTVHEFDGDELVPGQLEHGQVAQGGFGNAADDLITDGGIERQGSVEIGDTQAEVQRPHRAGPAGGSGRSTSNSLPSGSAMTTQLTSPWPMLKIGRA